MTAWYEEETAIQQLESLINTKELSMKRTFLDMVIKSENDHDISYEIDIPYDAIEVQEVKPTFVSRLKVESFSKTIDDDGIKLICNCKKTDSYIAHNLTLRLYNEIEDIHAIMNAIIRQK
jgi:hypothetical protein